MQPKVIAVDLDLSCTLDTSWTCEDCANAKPNKRTIAWVNDQYKTNFIVIHTARRHELYLDTVMWLARNNVRYHAIRMEKMGADIYLEDKAIRPEEL